MSQANSTVKVLRTALKRVQKAWGKGAWGQDTGRRDPETGKKIYAVCLEGAVMGFCNTMTTPQQEEALRLIKHSIKDMWLNRYDSENADHINIPSVNDGYLTNEQAEEVVKRALIKAETGFDPDNPEDLYLDEDETESILKGAMP